MESHYSILKYVNNPVSDESIAIGLIVVSEGKVFFKISDDKLDFAKKLNRKGSKLLDFSIKHFAKYVSSHCEDQPSRLIHSKNDISAEYLKRLSKYNNGILQFSSPSCIDHKIKLDNFKEYFNKFIGDGIDEKPLAFEAVSTLRRNIENELYKPLKDKIDVDFTLKRKQLDTLFFDFHLDSIGVNGSLYASKAIDLNSKKQLAQIRVEISEYESVIERLNIFAKKRGLGQDHKYYLIVDPYEGNAPSYNDLYSLLNENRMPLFTIISSNELPIVVDQVLQNNARKFSEELSLTSADA